jgi:hypothetical protein
MDSGWLLILQLGSELRSAIFGKDVVILSNQVPPLRLCAIESRQRKLPLKTKVRPLTSRVFLSLFGLLFRSKGDLKVRVVQPYPPSRKKPYRSV